VAAKESANFRSEKGSLMVGWNISILETPEELQEVERLQSLVWPGDERDVVPVHLMLAAVHQGGLVIGAYPPSSQPGEKIMAEVPEDLYHVRQLIGFVFSIPGFTQTTNGIKIHHLSHMLGVHPNYQNQGIGYLLKRAQWQMIRRQGIDHITWTYDPLLSRNAHLNISRLGAVCSTYKANYYGEMRDGLNIGLPSDRFVVDWWLNSRRVKDHLSKSPRQRLDLAHYLAADIEIINPSQLLGDGFSHPAAIIELFRYESHDPPKMVLLEIPDDFQLLRDANLEIAMAWRLQTRMLFERLFAVGYLVTDFIHLPDSRSFYILTFGESTL
jgi:predicted GNAT superfamily acetyltransferase